MQPVNARMHALIPPNPKAGAADAEDMRALLALPALAAPDRLALWGAWRDLAGRLNDEPSSPSEPLPAPDADAAKKDEHARALVRARASVALLRLDGGDVTKADTALNAAAKDPGDDAAVRTLCRELRADWKRLDEAHGR